MLILNHSHLSSHSTEKSPLKEVQIRKNFTSGAGNRMKHLSTVWTATIVGSGGATNRK